MVASGLLGGNFVAGEMTINPLASKPSALTALPGCLLLIWLVCVCCKHWYPRKTLPLWEQCSNEIPQCDHPRPSEEPPLWINLLSLLFQIMFYHTLLFCSDVYNNFFFVLIRVQLPLRMVTALMEIFIKMKSRVLESCVVWVDLRTVESGDIARWTDKLLLQTQFSYNCLLFNHKQQNHPLFACAKWKTEVIEIVSLTELVSKLKVFSFSHSGWFMGTRSTLTEQRKISINVEFLLY